MHRPLVGYAWHGVDSVPRDDGACAWLPSRLQLRARGVHIQVAAARPLLPHPKADPVGRPPPSALLSSEIKCAEKSRDDAETAAPSRYNAIPPEYQLGPHKSVYTIDFARKPKCHLFGRPPGDNKLSIETLVATSGDAAGGGSAVFGPCFRPCTNFDTVFQVHAELEPRA